MGGLAMQLLGDCVEAQPDDLQKAKELREQAGLGDISASAQALEQLPDVIIDEGTFKYVLLRVTAASGERKYLVRGTLGAEFHKDVALPYLRAYLKDGFGVEILGGGRILHDVPRGFLKIYGFSYGFPWADGAGHEISAEVCREFFSGYEAGQMHRIRSKTQRCFSSVVCTDLIFMRRLEPSIEKYKCNLHHVEVSGLTDVARPQSIFKADKDCGRDLHQICRGALVATVEEQRRDEAFMERLQRLAREAVHAALTWPFLEDHRRLIWAAVLQFNAVPTQDLPPWFFEQKNFTRRHLGVDLCSLDGKRAILCRVDNATLQDVKRFLRTARCMGEAPQCTLWTLRGCKIPGDSKRCLRKYGCQCKILTKTRLRNLMQESASEARESGEVPLGGGTAPDPPLRPCQEACLEACAKGARVIEMACGTGKTRVIRELAAKQTGKVLVTVPSRILLEQFAQEMPGFCKLGTKYNSKIDMASRLFVAVSDSVRLLKKLEFEAAFVDEAHHPLPPGMPSCEDLFKFSATHKEGVDFRFSLGEAIEQGVLCEYDLTVPVTTEGHPYVCLANLLLSQAGRFRRVLAYCNSIAEAKRFQQVLEITGLAAWHINGHATRKARERVMHEFSGDLKKPLHVLVTVQVLGEGVNIPNADTCMFVEPRSSYVSIIQAIGRVLRPHSTKPLSHIVLPAIAVPSMPTPNTDGAISRVLDEIAKSPESDARLSSSVVTAERVHDDPLELPVPLGRSAAGGPEELSRDVERRSEPEPNEHVTNALGNSSPGLQTDALTDGAGEWPSLACAELATNGKGRTGQVCSEADTATQTNSQTGSCSKRGNSTNERSVSLFATEATAQLSHARVVVEDPMLTSNPSAAPTPLSQYYQQDAQLHRLEAASMPPTAASKLKFKTRPGDSLVGNGHANQLDRFLEAIARADRRFADADLKHLKSRLWVMDCRLQQPLLQKLLVSNVQYQLALILQQCDAWDLNLRAVEQHARNRGRLPRQRSADPEEMRLGSWLQQVGIALGRQKLAATRVQKLSNSSCISLRFRLAKWLEAESPFERCVKMVRQFVQLHGRMPTNLKTSSRQESSLLWNLRGFVAHINKQREQRLQYLENQGPIIAQWARSMRARQLSLSATLWNRQFGRLIEFLETKNKVPTPGAGPGREHALYCWLLKQRSYLHQLPSEFREKLLDCHQAVACFLQAEGGRRASKDL
ncbi:PHPT1 [Symbiodinium necroappetens]|uniref:PHPT1 protein n=1 Tax=Symbiodinium necroappetens TaxID=1628268 RepID=A0A812Y6L9_9DINO|nr:PHPT1 [Symbiodinium necroappetens]